MPLQRFFEKKPESHKESLHDFFILNKLENRKF
jgi:hypothetical protein